MNEIFISYRREDSQHIVGRIYDYLSSQYKKNSVFMDVDSIPDGKNFKKVIENSIKSSKVILLIIGNKWVNVTDEDGNKRIFKENDFVKLEIEVALKYDIPIIPILVDSATMPKEEELPQSIKSITLNNARMIRTDPDFHDDIRKLVKSLDLIIKRINLKRRKYLLGISLFLATISIFGLIYFKVVKPYLDVAQAQAKEKQQKLYLQYVQQAKSAYNGRNYNSTLAKFFWAKAINLSNNLNDESYAKEKYFKIPSRFTKKINLKNIGSYHKAFNRNANEIAFCNNKKLILWDVKKNHDKFSIEHKNQCDGILLNNEDFIVTWNEKTIDIRNRHNGNLIKSIDETRTKYGGIAIDNNSKLIVSWADKKATLFDFSEDKIKRYNLVDELKQPLTNKSLQEGIRFYDIKFTDSALLIHFRKNIHYKNYNNYPYINSMLFDFKKRKITSAWLNDEYIYLSKDNNFIATTKEGYGGNTSYLYVREKKNKTNALKWSNMFGKVKQVSFSDKQLYFKENFYDTTNQKHLSILRIFSLKELNKEKTIYAFIVSNNNLLTQYIGEAIVTLNKHGLYTKYSLQHETLDKEDYILRTEIGTGQRLTSSGDLIDIDPLELKHLKEKFIKKYGRYDEGIPNEPKTNPI